VTVPTSLVAGDTWAWTETLTDYPASAWTATWYFQNEGGAFWVAGAADGDVHTASAAASVTAARKPGSYFWRLTVEQSDGGSPEVIERRTVGEGWTTVQPNPAKGGAIDHRSTAQIMLDNVEAYLRDPSNLTASQVSYKGRQLSRWNRADLIQERNQLREEVRRESGAPSRLKVRFDRA
jgi:hypothetical protein